MDIVSPAPRGGRPIMTARRRHQQLEPGRDALRRTAVNARMSARGSHWGGRRTCGGQVSGSGAMASGRGNWLQAARRKVRGWRARRDLRPQRSRSVKATAFFLAAAGLSKSGYHWGVVAGRSRSTQQPTPRRRSRDPPKSPGAVHASSRAVQIAAACRVQVLRYAIIADSLAAPVDTPTTRP